MKALGLVVLDKKIFNIFLINKKTLDWAPFHPRGIGGR
jgi:hypothetical protein